MIEAVNSTIVNATIVRGVAEQMDSSSVSPVATVLPASGSDAAPSAPQEPFVSPCIAVDLSFNKPVLQIRDTQTGDVKRQFPTENQMASIASTQAQVLESAQTTTSTAVATTASSGGSQNVAGSSMSQMAMQTVDVTTVQDVTSTPVSNTASSTPQVAVAALSTAAQSTASSAASATESTSVTVYA